MKPTICWTLAAAAAAYASHLAVRHPTPVDAALPWLAVGVTLLAALSYVEVMLAVPLLIAIELAIPSEETRLLAIGVVWSAAAAIALAKEAQPIVVALLAILSLRWIPFEDVQLGRELVLLAVAVAIVYILGRTPFAVAVAVIAALVTPAVPLRTMAIPLLVLLVAIAARAFGMPRLALRWPSAIAVGFALLFFAWSGVVARAFPYFLRQSAPARWTVEIRDALAPGESVSYRVAEGARSLVVSGANVAALRRGAPLGRIEPGGRVIRIGDAADWGYLRRAEFHGSRNPLPRDAAGKIRGYGYEAWVDGAGRVPLPPGARTIRVTADPSLGAGQLLQVEGFE